MVNVWLSPGLTVTIPVGEMVPLAPAEAVMVWWVPEIPEEGTYVQAREIIGFPPVHPEGEELVVALDILLFD